MRTFNAAISLTLCTKYALAFSNHGGNAQYAVASSSAVFEHSHDGKRDVKGMRQDLSYDGSKGEMRVRGSTYDNGKVKKYDKTHHVQDSEPVVKGLFDFTPHPIHFWNWGDSSVYNEEGIQSNFDGNSGEIDKAGNVDEDVESKLQNGKGDEDGDGGEDQGEEGKNKEECEGGKCINEDGEDEDEDEDEDKDEKNINKDEDEKNINEDEDEENKNEDEDEENINEDEEDEKNITEDGEDNEEDVNGGSELANRIPRLNEEILEPDYKNLTNYVESYGGLNRHLRISRNHAERKFVSMLTDMQKSTKKIYAPKVEVIAEKIKNLKKSKKTEINVIDMDTLDCATTIMNMFPHGKVAILNMANSFEPCNNVHLGTVGQEQELCRRTLLNYAINPKLNQYIPKVYRQDAGAVYYSKGVPIIVSRKSNDLLNFADAYPISPQVDVISSAAQKNLAGKDLRNKPQQLEKYEKVMGRSIQAQLYAAAINGARHLVLGAFGCGAYAGLPEHVAGLYRKEFDGLFKGVFDTVTFAIKTFGEKDVKTLETFQSIFK